ncbi:VAMP7b [Chondrus crispus]|uniref:VAMP7b n=1 Tax=Chondrus crispus TaxID=2769 RepID=R7QHV8_CHOCR|nr:VAMP7b [Chondrus crispus]CDF38102.1 VAMP7b [Chondrus crispus]|eukprot:XP_005717971.1 VAMP7b [Chondrus crispus]
MANVVYMGIARVPDKQILVSCVATDSREQSKQQLDSILSRVLVSGRIDEHDRLTIADKDVGNIHYSADPALVYLVITATNYPQRTAFKLLSEARAEFEQEFKTELAGGKNDGVAKVAKPFLKRMMDRYEDVAREDKISSVALQVDQVKGLMQTNIQAALKNQENLETLLDSSDTMRNEASTFNRSTKDAKERMRWKSLKMNIFIFVLVLTLALLVLIPLFMKKREGETKA